MIRRLEVQNDILYSKLAHLDIKFPKLEKKRNTTKIFALPSEEEIAECLNRAKRFALDDASRFGMLVNADEIDVCELSMPNRLETDDDMNDCCDDDDTDDEFVNGDVDEDTYENMENDVILGEENEDQHRAFVTFTDHLGKKQLIRKSTLVWTLNEGTKKISSDRLIRVQQKGDSVKPDLPNDQQISDIVYVSNHIKLGDWCFYNTESDQGEMVFVGSINAFRFANRRLVKEKTYKFDSVDIKDAPGTKEKILKMLPGPLKGRKSFFHQTTKIHRHLYSHTKY